MIPNKPYHVAFGSKKEDSPKPKTKKKTKQKLRIPNIDKNLLRTIMIDCSNVAREHGKENGGTFSCKGIILAIDYFRNKGHKVEAYIPRKLNERLKVTDRDLLEKYKNVGIVKECPPKSYDDRFVIESAIHNDGLIISNDQYRDLIHQKPEYREKLKYRLIEFVFSGDYFMPPEDPWGRNAPSLSQVLLKSFTLPTNNPIKPILHIKDFKTENFEKLKTIFPNMEQKIRELVFEKYVTENNLHFFIDHILDTHAIPILKDHAVAKSDESSDSDSDSDSEDESVYRTYSRGDIEVSPYTVRSARETEDMREKLREMFCQNKIEIDQALQEYPSKTDLNFFIDKLVQYLD